MFERGDLGVFAAVDQAHLFDPGHLRREADAARALNAAGHDGLDQRPHVFLFDRPLVFLEAAAVETIGHGLVLQVAFAALIADRAIQGVIDQKEFHHALARLFDGRGVGLDHHAFARRHGAGRNRLRRALHLHQAHAAVAGHREALVIAEAGNFDAGHFASLQHRHAVRHLDFPIVDGELWHARPYSAACRLL